MSFVQYREIYHVQVIRYRSLGTNALICIQLYSLVFVTVNRIATSLLILSAARGNKTRMRSLGISLKYCCKINELAAEMITFAENHL